MCGNRLEEKPPISGTYYVVASSPDAAICVCLNIYNGALPNIYKTGDDALRAYAYQPMPMQARYFPFSLTFVEGKYVDEEYVEGRCLWHRLDIPNERQRVS